MIYLEYLCYQIIDSCSVVCTHCFGSLTKARGKGSFMKSSIFMLCGATVVVALTWNPECEGPSVCLWVLGNVPTVFCKYLSHWMSASSSVILCFLDLLQLTRHWLPLMNLRGNIISIGLFNWCVFFAIWSKNYTYRMWRWPKLFERKLMMLCVITSHMNLCLLEFSWRITNEV